VLPRVHWAFRQFVRPVGPPPAGASIANPDSQTSKDLVDPKNIEDGHAKSDSPPEKQTSQAPGTEPEDLSEQLQQATSPTLSKQTATHWSASQWLEILANIFRTSNSTLKKSEGGGSYRNQAKRGAKGIALKKGAILDKKAA
jgi:hypothetical protein